MLARLVDEPLTRGDEVAGCCAGVERWTLDLRLEPKPRLFSRELMLPVYIHEDSRRMRRGYAAGEGGM